MSELENFKFKTVIKLVNRHLKYKLQETKELRVRLTSLKNGTRFFLNNLTSISRTIEMAPSASFGGLSSQSIPSQLHSALLQP